MICITCVDALLGTDMERVCRKAEERVGLPVRPCYMYALTREGRKPPMVHVRQSLYSLLEPRKKKGNVVNLLGFFAPLMEDCELYDYLKAIGVRTIHEISREPDLQSFYTMAEANINLVLHSEARMAASDLEERLKIPFIVALKGAAADQELREAERAIRALGGSYERTEVFPIGGASHQVLVIRKTAPTAPRYPRPWSQIKKKPL